MQYYVKVLRNEYFDSVTLMALTARLQEAAEAQSVTVLMGTPANLEQLQALGFARDALSGVSGYDCVIGIVGGESAKDLVEQVVQELKMGKRVPSVGSGEVRAVPSTIAGACGEFSANLAIISTPGEYATREARLALEQGLHVMIFSDNVPLASEVELKQMARAKGLFVMGPDCGTAIINGKGLCFANQVRRGNIGLVAASGTGLQEVSVLIHRLGGGVSQAIGVGGRDLSLEVGGIMMQEGVKALARDSETAVIVLISKPPALAVQGKILELVSGLDKPCVICFLDGDAPPLGAAHLRFEPYLEGAARAAINMAMAKLPHQDREVELLSELATIQAEPGANPSQKYIRALYSGGTLCAEAVAYARGVLPSIYSNVAKKAEEKLIDPMQSRGHSFVDLGDDVFTKGRPHPMIDPSQRLLRLSQEAEDPETKVLLLDYVLGFGSHPDPVGLAEETLQSAIESAKRKGRHLTVVAYVCGTELDAQNLTLQQDKLRRLGVMVAESNLQAAKLACQIVLRRD